MKNLDLVIIGAHKSGTSSLFRHLAAHPEICGHRQDEFPFFVDDAVYTKGYECALRDYFPTCDRVPVFVAKNVGIMYVPKAVERLKSHSPDAWLVAILRNPIDRAYSAFWYARQLGREPLGSFEQALELESVRMGELGNREERQYAYFHRGQYADQLEHVYGFFSRSKVRIFLFEDLVKNPSEIYLELLGLLAVDSEFSPNLSKKHNTSGIAKSAFLAKSLHQHSVTKMLIGRALPEAMRIPLKRFLDRKNKHAFRPPPMNQETRERLREEYLPHNKRLEAMIERDLSAWK